MKIYLPANAIIIPINRDGKVYYFFLDTGFPSSFSKDLNLVNNISNKDIHIRQKFNLPLSKAPIDVSSLSQHLMMDLTGFLGMDFVSQFDNFKINFRTRELDFNVDEFTSDLELSLVYTNPFLAVDLSVDSPDNFGNCLVDTGTYQSIFFDKSTIGGGHLKSNGWKFPWALGTMIIDFYAGVEAHSRSGSLGKFVFGCPTNLPPMPFDSVLGLNILSQYECCFNLNKRQLQLKTNQRDFRYGADLTEDMHTVGVQVIFNGENLCVSNVLPGFSPAAIGLNDTLQLPNIDLNAPEAVNGVCEALSSKGCAKDINVFVNGSDITVRTSKLFR
jgi:hypothetical protein